MYYFCLIIIVVTIIYCNNIMGIFGFSLSNLFGKTVKHSSHKHHRPANKTHRRKSSNKRASNKKARRSRKYKMRGG